MTEQQTQDQQCICQGNWRAIVKECEPLMDKRFRDEREREFGFFGVVHASDDYYYGMWSKEHGLVLLSCVGSIEGHGYTQVPDEPACGRCMARTERECVCLAPCETE